MRWEYTTMQVKAKGFFLGGAFDASEFQNELNKLGAEGWELVSVFDTNMVQGQTRDIVAVFKRQRA